MLTEEGNQYSYLQQVNVMACTSQRSVEALCEIFGEMIIK
jgi:hypothetical protein